MSIFDRVAKRLQMMLVKALIESVDDTSDIQLVKISGLEDEVIEGMERLQAYGLTSLPPKGSEAVAAFLQGGREHGVVFVVDSGANRPTHLNEGEVALYCMHGQKILMDDYGDTRARQSGSFIVGKGTTSVAVADVLDNYITALDNVLRTWTVTAQDGGAALKAAYIAAVPSPPQSMASTNLKAE